MRSAVRVHVRRLLPCTTPASKRRQRACGLGHGELVGTGRHMELLGSHPEAAKWEQRSADNRRHLYSLSRVISRHMRRACGEEWGFVAKGGEHKEADTLRAVDRA
ncbi:hypothetical protein K461DRAFT_275024 [Myriangium duriaei CBS 260.36]|uniref:Uncharacterized protein n=1 Tax=Myriangium duriaei CBS 260.36 TaxID=1168546 RepID=A0A9P4MK44_9PEZI|nr:hypothetical protein K461DRAFT_275024 [Myriangium duriaei CBS 260.36]